ncbi:MAG TPA: oligoendopeptidase F, partial [Bacillota bacterium]|nr:oligoendopeptidase F [Bacillota bacterium]
AEDQWVLTDIYGNDQDWENDFRELKTLVEEMRKVEPVFLNSAADLLAGLQLKDRIGRLLDKLYIYARLHRDENNANPTYQALTGRIQSYSVEAGGVLSFMAPALVNFSPEQLKAYLAEKPELNLYRHFFDELLRQQNHVLSTAEEKILADSGEIADAADSIFNMLDNADLKFPSILDENGLEVELTKARYGSFLESKDRRVRQDAFNALYSVYSKFRNTLGATLNASIRSDVFYAKTRRFDSARGASLDSDNISLAVYDNLIETVHNYLPVLERYLNLRKKVLNLPELHFYDLYTPLIPEYQKNFSYAEAKEIVLDGLRPLGNEYVNLVRKGFEEGWVDVYENEGKTSGAFSFGVYDTHPYVLLNYEGKIRDIFTIAHEMGHALHTYYSNRQQPYIYAGYKIFVAEVASTVNETLLMEYLLANSTDLREKQYLINQYLEEFRGTVYRQTMFAEFEKITHAEVESGGALTSEWLSEKYLELNQRYYGSTVVIDPEIAMEWSRIPHFYHAFYVYKYATGHSAAVALAQQIMKSAGKPEKYLEFLAGGDSDYPLALLKKAGVNMESPEPVQDALEVFKKLLDELTGLFGVKI